MLNLTKGQSLDLNKQANITLTKVRVGAGWDMADTGKPIDLDLWLIAKGQAPCYFNNLKIAGAELDGDDRTGGKSADGADENINIDVANLTSDEYTVVIDIFGGKEKGQTFKDVKHAFVEIVDAATGTKICDYAISENGGDNTNLVVGKLTKVDGALTFHADHVFSTKDITTVVTECGGQA